MAQPKTKKPTKLTVHREGEEPGVFHLADSTDWSIFAENVLEIKAASGITQYIPLDSLSSWTTQSE